MWQEDKDMLLCDLAETYGIYDVQSMPMRYVATLACGLRGDSRIVAKMGGVTGQPPVFMLLAQLIDSVNTLTWTMVGDKDNPPGSVVDELLNKKKEKSGFDTAEEYERARQEIIGRINRGK